MKNLAIILTIVLFIIGCGETDPDNEGNHIPDVNIIQEDQTVQVGEFIQLSSVALDVDKDDMTYQWSFVSKPADSRAKLTTDQTKKSSFIADKAGEYKIKFVATDPVGAEGSETVVFTATEDGAVSMVCTTYTELSENITSDTILDGCYSVTTILYISDDATLTIKAGSTLMFESATGLKVSSDGALKAVGTAQKPILFTGEQKTAGYWEGVSFRGSDNSNNEMSYTTIEYAGGGNNIHHGALYLIGNYGSDNRLKISNSTIQHSIGYGFDFEKRTVLEKFENVTSTKNEKTAGAVDVSVLDQLDTQSDFTGNLGGDYIVLEGSTVSKDAVWKALSVPVNIPNSLYIDAFLTINSGLTLVVDSGQIIRIHASGSLKAVGTAKEPIIFTGKEQTAGYWHGMHFEMSNSTNNILEYINLEYAGGGSDAGLDLDSRNDISFTRVSVRNSTFSNNAGYGIYIDYDDNTQYNKDIDSSNTFFSNEDGEVGRR